MQFEKFLQIFCACILAALSGCKANTDSLKSFVSQLESSLLVTPKSVLADGQVTSQSHQASNSIIYIESPITPLFLSQMQSSSDSAQKVDCSPLPKKYHQAVVISPYSSDELRYRGYFELNSHKSALVETPSGKLLQVSVGDTVGLNNGKVTEIMPAEISVEESVQNSRGCYIRQTVKLVRE
ncbi:pilus assembly protein PilP [Vibrio marisflavi]|uniref:Pilus assembly protein, PilP n=1 Tax=Vibrio marisflavi CECT 7928 TaxID=634439 RepID=A0ABN8ED06_9VIBR|nr:pilus assembly protein PilP [Vibrio marisflavi]CAH0541674.1 hypothetical protein VMF7928_03740 [Vibrio marisflavi CECT 7928]